MVHLFMKFVELGILVYGMSTVQEDTGGCAKKYICALAIYLMTVLSYLYGIITNFSINVPFDRNNVVNGLNDIEKCYLEGGKGILGKS